MSPIFTRNGHSQDERDGLRETVQRQRWQMEHLEESIRTLETTLSGDSEWRRMGSNLEREFTRGGLDDLIRLSRAMYLSHPLIQRAVNVTTYYTWGQGVEFSGDDRFMDGVVLPMTTDAKNKAELYGHQARLLTDVDQLVDGNTFTALLVGSQPAQVRSIPADEIRKIHCNPDDYRDVWYYRRVWNAVVFTDGGEERIETREALYPDIGNNPTTKPDSIGGIEVRWDAPVVHQRVGGLKHMQFGVPATYAALDWARAYRRFLEDWHTIVSSLARFAWRATTKGSKVDALKRKLGTKVGSEEAAEGSLSSGAPPAGSIWAGVDGDNLTPIPKTGAHTSSEDARPSRLMVGAAMDLPDTILSGDADVGNLATAKTLDRPTELAMSSRQSMWADWHATVFTAAASWSREGFENVPESELIKVNFPPILEHDPDAAVRALVSAATLDGKAEAGTIPHEELARQLMSAVGIENVQEALDSLGDEDRQQVDQAVERLREMLDE